MMARWLPWGVGLEAVERVWNASTGAPLTDLLTHGGSVYSVDFTPDDMCLVTTSGVPGTDRGEVRLIRLPVSDSGLQLRQNSSVFSGRVTPDGLRLVTL